MSTAPPVLIIVHERDHVKGPDIAPVTLLAYCDFECPYSGQIYPIIETLLKQVGDHVQYIFRHFPVLHKHAHAQHAAEAAEAAKKKADEEKLAKAKADNCTRARQAKAAFDSGKPITQSNAQGERIFLDEAGRAAESKRIDGIIAADCKR